MKITLDSKVPRLYPGCSVCSSSLGLGTDTFARVKHSYLIDLNSKTATDVGALGGWCHQASTTQGE